MTESSSPESSVFPGLEWEKVEVSSEDVKGFGIQVPTTLILGHGESSNGLYWCFSPLFSEYGYGLSAEEVIEDLFATIHRYHKLLESKEGWLSNAQITDLMMHREFCCHAAVSS